MDIPITNVLQDNVTAASYDVNDLREMFPDWDSLTKSEKLTRLEDVEPEFTVSTHNVITQPYRAHLAKLLNPEDATAAVDTTHMAFGDDSTATDPSDTHLINEVYRDAIDDHTLKNSEEAYAGTLLLQSSDAVNENLLEAALVTESDPTNDDDMAVNRALLNDSRLDPKSGDQAVTVTIQITYLDDSEVA